MRRDTRSRGKGQKEMHFFSIALENSKVVTQTARLKSATMNVVGDIILPFRSCGTDSLLISVCHLYEADNKMRSVFQNFSEEKMCSFRRGSSYYY